MSFKKASKTFVLSDSSVNELGFRLDTKGYQLNEFGKNPIGFGQHKRDEGIVVKWEDLAVDGDKITGTPVINLSHPKGQQIYDEVENGFLNAASMGYFVFEEWTMDPALMLAGQTGPTITKWYNKECSLVDIPGNANALKMCGMDGAEITLAALFDTKHLQTKNEDMNTIALTPEAAKELKLAAGTNDSAVINAAIITLAARAENAETGLANYKKEAEAKEIKAMLETALTGNKITVALSTQFEKDYEGRPEALKTVLENMGAYQSVTGKIDDATKKLALKYEGLSWDDLLAKDLVLSCKKECPDLCNAIYKETFNKDMPK